MSKKIMNFVLLSTIVLLLITTPCKAIGSEKTRHITGDGTNIYFMQDKVFGVINNHPIWAIYNCGSDISGEVDKNGTYISFSFNFPKEGGKRVAGTFGKKEIGLGNIEKTDKKLVYHVLVNGKEYLFSVIPEKIEGNHMVNSVIEGTLDKSRIMRFNVDGELCPFATTGIILIVSGAML